MAQPKTGEDIVIRRSLLFGVVLLILGFIWAVGGVVLTVLFWIGLGWEWGMAFLAGCGLGAAVLGGMGYYKVRDRAPVLILSERGFVDCRQGAALVSWAQVRKVDYEQTTLQGGDFHAVLVVTVHDPRRGAHSTVQLRVDHLDRTSDEIWALFGRFCGLQQGQAARSPASEGPSPVRPMRLEDASSELSPSPARTVLDEKELCYLCGKRLKEEELPSRVCRACRLGP
jgi:hypothetical protein